MTSIDCARPRVPIIVLCWLLLVGSTVSLAASASASSAAPHTPHPRTGVVNAVDFVDAHHGWIAGDHGEIMATSNAGLTWMFQHGTGPAITSLDFVDRLHGWATAGSRVLRTVDGGLSWDSRAAPGSGLFSVQFVGRLNGWALGARTSTRPEPTSFFRSTDGGRHWDATGARFDDVCRTSVADGWAIVGREVSHTSDAGQTWSRPTQLPGVLGIHWTGSIQCDGTALWALLRGEGGASNQGPAVAFRSLDAGAPWRPVLTEGYFPSLPQRVSAGIGGFAGYAQAFASVGRSAIFSVYCGACDHSASVTVTHDGGMSFRSTTLPLGPPQLVSPDATSFSDARHGWLVVRRTFGNRSESELLRTTDGGATWHGVYPTYLASQAAPGATAGPIAVPQVANQLVAADGSIWAASDHTLVRIDPSMNAITCRVRIAVQGLSAGGGSIWVVARRGITRIDAATCRVTGRYLGPSKYRRTIAVGAGAIWVVPARGHRLLRIDPTTGAVAQLPGFPADAAYSIVAGAGSLWGWSLLTASVYRIDLASGRVATPNGIEIGGRSATIAIRGGLLWAIGSDGTLLKLDAGSGQRLASFKLRDFGPGGGYTAAPGARALWLFAHAVDDQRVMKVDPETGRIIRWEFASGNAILAAFGSRWITTDGPVVRFR